MAGDTSKEETLPNVSCPSDLNSVNGEENGNCREECQQNGESTGNSDSNSTLSKRALKRLKKKEIWDAKKGQRRAAERERRKKRAAEDRKKRAEDPEGAPTETFNQFRKRLKKNLMSTSACEVSVVIDCNWEHLMEMKDVQKLAKQIQYAYTTNRRLDDPVQFFVTGLNPGSMLKEKLDRDYSGYDNWDIYLKADGYAECFKKKKIVYLTSESENVLDKLEDDKVYVIGGLVDHNQHKGICHSTAVSRGIAHARLPIDEFMEMKTRKVLTVNHVFDILASASGGATWEDAFTAAIPSRKGAVVKKEEGKLADDKDDEGKKSVVDGGKDQSENEDLKKENDDQPELGTEAEDERTRLK